MILVSAAEPSGDRLAADLVSALGVPARGLAGPAMRAAGVEAIGHAEELGLMGLFEVVEALPRAWRLHRDLVQALDGCRLLVVVDAPDFNIPLARAAKKRGVPVLFYVSPQVWAWRAGRARTIAELAEKVICLLPFEPALYPDGKAVFLGSPVAERCPRLGEASSNAWCLAPGSRQQEVERLLPVMLQASEGHERLLAAAPGLDLNADVQRVEGLSEAARRCPVALVASGTATLELACMGRPMVVVYRVGALTYSVAKALVDVPFIALPNLIMGRQVVPEFVQQLDPEVLRRELEAAEGGQDLEEVRNALWPEGAGERIADLVRGYL